MGNVVLNIIIWVVSAVLVGYAIWSSYRFYKRIPTERLELFLVMLGNHPRQEEAQVVRTDIIKELNRRKKKNGNA